MFVFILIKTFIKIAASSHSQFLKAVISVKVNESVFNVYVIT